MLISMSFATFPLDLNSYRNYQVCVTKSISLVEMRFLVVTRTLWCSIPALVLLLSFQLILSRTYCIHNTYHRSLKHQWRKTSLLHVHYSVDILYLLFILIRSITLLETLVSISGSVWVENSLCQKMLFELLHKIPLLLRLISLHLMCWLYFDQIVRLSAFVMLVQYKRRDIFLLDTWLWCFLVCCDAV